MYCIFCYKKVAEKVKVRIKNEETEDGQNDDSNNDTSATENLEEVSKFFTSAGKHFGQGFDEGEDLSLELGENLVQLKETMECCKDCLWNIRTFNECYHQLKNVKLKLVARMESVRDVMKFADKVPSRVKPFREALKMKEGTSSKVKLAAISKFRQKVINYCSDLLKVSSEGNNQRNVKQYLSSLTAHATGQRLHQVAPNTWSQNRYQISALILPFLLLPQNPPPTNSSEVSGDTTLVDTSVFSSNASTQTEYSRAFFIDPGDAAQPTCGKDYIKICNADECVSTKIRMTEQNCIESAIKLEHFNELDDQCESIGISQEAMQNETTVSPAQVFPESGGDSFHAKNDTVSESVPEIESIIWTETLWSHVKSTQPSNHEPCLSSNSLICKENAKIVKPPTSSADCCILQGNPVPNDPGPNAKLVHCPSCHTKFFPVIPSDLAQKSNRTESSSSTSDSSSSDSENMLDSQKSDDEYQPSDTENHSSTDGDQYVMGKRSSRKKPRYSRNRPKGTNQKGLRATRSASSDADCQIVNCADRNESGVQTVTLSSSGSSGGTSDTSIDDDLGQAIVRPSRRKRPPRRKLNYDKC